MSARIQVRDVGKERGGRKVLRDVSFSLETGQHLVVFGSNGAGKTTLLRLLALLDKPSSGSIVYSDGEELEDAQARARIGFITHAPLLYLDLSAQENLMLYARLHGLPHPGSRVEELLETVGLAHRANDAVRGFSRGMTQRLAVARALLASPDVLLLDEVYSGLDSQGARVVRELVRREAGRCIVVEVSHDFESGYADATDVLLLDRGRVAGLLVKGESSQAEVREHYSRLLQERPA